MFQLHESTYLFISHQFMCNVVDMYHFVQLEIQEIIAETVCPLLHKGKIKRNQSKAIQNLFFSIVFTCCISLLN